jgi:hypothetical protein
MPGKEHGFKKYRKELIGTLLFVISNFLQGQTAHDMLPSGATLSQCINYALANQSLVRQALIFLLL